jgi:hypothetical protein
MKTLMLVSVGLFVIATVQAAPRDRLVTISDATGVPVETLRVQRAATGFGYGELETANLLANASGQSFDTIAARHQAGEGWGKIAQGYGFKLGEIVSAAHRSDQAALHARGGHGNTKSEFARDGRANDDIGRGHGKSRGAPQKGKGKSK